jgi:hypothetical protein
MWADTPVLLGVPAQIGSQTVFSLQRGKLSHAERAMAASAPQHAIVLSSSSAPKRKRTPNRTRTRGSDLRNEHPYARGVGGGDAADAQRLVVLSWYMAPGLYTSNSSKPLTYLSTEGERATHRCDLVVVVRMGRPCPMVPEAQRGQRRTLVC